MATVKPNVLIMWGDDIGQSNLSCYAKGMMGYKTPNIDRIANEGLLFTDAYAEQSFYFTDDGDVAALRYDNWKMLFMEQRVPGTLKIWQEPFVTLRTPYIFNLRMDPYERAQITSNTYYDWMSRHIFLLVPAQAIVAEFLATFKEFPPRQESASFSLDQVIEKMTEASSGA